MMFRTQKFAVIPAVCASLILTASTKAQKPYDLELGERPEIPEISELGKTALTEKVTYLGVTTKPVDPDLQAQLKLPDGVGLVVAFVDARGPAAADIQTGDVLQKLDDQILIDTHQLVTLVRMHHRGDSVVLSIIHEAKPTTVTIKLGEKERHIVAAPSGVDANDSLPGVPPPDFDYQLPTTPGSQVAMAFDDGTFSANVNSDKDGIRQMVVKDRTGAVVAKGPVETEAQWNVFPEEIRNHLQMLHKMLTKKQT